MKEKIVLFLSLTMLVITLDMFIKTENKINRWQKERADLIENYSVYYDEHHTLNDWDLLRLAIIKTECDFNSNAVGTSQDFGIFQITPIYVKDVNRILNKNEYNHDDAFDINKSLEMFDIIQKHYNPNFNADKAIKIHNPYGDTVGYSERVKKNMEFIYAYEKVRNAIIDTKN